MSTCKKVTSIQRGLHPRLDSPRVHDTSCSEMEGILQIELFLFERNSFMKLLAIREL